MNKLFILFCFLAALGLGNLSAANPIEEKQKRIEFLKNEGYIWGEGSGDTQSEAHQNAVLNLLSKIGMTIESNFSQSDEETTVNGVIDSKTNIKSVLNSYSNATVNNTQQIDYRSKDGSYYNFRYMHRSELEKIFEQRKDRIDNFVLEAMRAEEKGRVDDALKNLSFANALLYSLQYPGQARTVVNGDSKLLVNWIPLKMKDILDNIKVSGVEYDETDNSANIFVYYKDKPALGADFTYYTGTANSELNSVKDGMGRISFDPSYSPESDVTLVFETSYVDACQIDRELETLVKNSKPLKFKEAQKSFTLPSKKAKADKAVRTDFQAQLTAGKREGVTPLEKKDVKEYDKIVSEVLKSVRNKSYQPDSTYFTGDGLYMFRQLLAYGNATILGNPEVGYYPFGQRVVARSVPMKFSFKNNRRSFVEDVTFTFSPDKKIESVAFGLGSAARRDIFEQGVGAWSDSVKMVIVTFLENYKTAFALKRLDYINSIFDENAHIIVGHKLEPMKRVEGDVSGFSMMPKYEYAQKSKEDYMKQLKKCFASNEFVNINFSDNDVQKSSYGGDTFGIQIKQDYYSEHYGDQGYLFLFVDLNDADRPIIKVRTWQPERNPDLTPMLPKSSRDFGIYSNSLLR